MPNSFPVNQNPGLPAATPLPPTTPNGSEHASSGKSPVLLIILFVATGLICGILGYVIALQTHPVTKTEPAKTVSSVPMVSPQPTAAPTAAPAASLPADWSYKESSACAVMIPLPPRKAPYLVSPAPGETDGQFWEVADFASIGGPTSISRYLDNLTRITYQRPGDMGESGSQIEVWCSPNPTHQTTQAFAAQIEAELTAPAQTITVKSKNEISKWGNRVVDLVYVGETTGGEDYIFANDKGIYVIRKVSVSGTQTVRDTTDRIFDQLSFAK